MNGRHAASDPVSVALGTAWTAFSAVALALLALTARTPDPYAPTKLPVGPAPATAPDHPAQSP